MLLILGLISTRGSCDYSSIKSGTVRVHGMPKDVPFKHPSWMGRKQLRKILDSADGIRFTSKKAILVEHWLCSLQLANA